MTDESDTEYSVTVVENADDINENEWNNVVRQADESSIFHRYEWIAAVEDGLGYSPKHLLIENDPHVVAVYPNFEIEFDRTPATRLTSLYPGFGGPVATTDEPKCISLFSERIADITAPRTLAHRVRAKERGYLGYNNLLKTHGYRTVRDGCRFLIHLDDGYDDIVSNMRRDRRRKIQQAHDERYEFVEETLTAENLRQFYDVYEQAMDRVDGTTFPLSFLTELQRMESDVLLLTLRIEGEYAGGLVALLDEADSSIHGWLLAVDEAYFDNHASELLHAGVFKWGIEHGYDTYDMGYTSSDATDGLFTYKKSYGGELIPNLIWEKSCSPIWPLVRTGRGLYWSHVKSPPV